MILGADPGIAHFGIALVEIGLQGELVPIEMAVHVTKKDKAAPYVSADNDRRCGDLARWLNHYVRTYPIDVICIEAMSYPRSSSAAAKSAMARAALVTLAATNAIPVIECRPHDIKVQIAGVKGATKKLIQSIIEDDYPQAIELTAGIAKGKQEHCFDALAAIATIERKGELATWV